MRKFVLFFLLFCSTSFAQYSDFYTAWQKTNTAYSPKNIFQGTTGQYLMVQNGSLFTTNELFDVWNKVGYAFFQNYVNDIFYAGNSVYLAGTISTGIYRALGISTWTRITSGLPDTISVTAFAKHPGGTIYAGTDKGVYASTNSGLSWTQNQTLPANFKVSQIKIDNGGKIYVTENQSSPGQGRGMYRSLDNGLSWQKVNEVPNYEIFSLIYINPAGNVFVSGMSAAGGIPTYGLYKSNTGADSFKIVSNTNPTSIINTQFNSYIATFNYYTVSGSSYYIAVSTNGGVNWTTTFQNNSNLRYYNLFALSGGSFIATSDYAGLLKSTNLGNNWTIELKGIPAGWKATKVLCRGTYIYAIANSELFRTSTDGYTWERTDFNLPYPYYSNVKDITYFNNDIYIIRNSSPYKSTDNGANFTQIPAPTVGLNGIRLNNSGNIFIYGNGVYRTTNNGANWDALVNGYPAGAQVNALEIDNSSNTIYLGTNTSGIYKSTNNGSEWVQCSNGFTSTNVLSILPTGSTVYAGTSGFGFFTSTNSGDNWTKANSGIATDNLNFTSIVPNISGIYNFNDVITSTGAVLGNQNYKGVLFYRSNSLPQWYSLNSRETVNDSSINSLCWKNYGKLFAAGDSGVYWQGWGDGVRTISNEIPDKYSLSQNYPNPFNPSTVIRYQLSVAGFTTLKVFDLLGKEVATLLNEKQSVGSYAVDFNSTEYSLPSGIYFYTLSAGEFKETRKMVLIK